MPESTPGILGGSPQSYDTDLVRGAVPSSGGGGDAWATVDCVPSNAGNTFGALAALPFPAGTTKLGSVVVIDATNSGVGSGNTLTTEVQFTRHSDGAILTLAVATTQPDNGTDEDGVMGPVHYVQRSGAVTLTIDGAVSTLTLDNSLTPGDYWSAVHARCKSSGAGHGGDGTASTVQIVGAFS